uniref:Uncharacterized protein n=1 Tax=Lotharella globosa TaxID=91324 RepID=A0A7S3YRZ7_9EUKA|mmetsp:Transcript_16928/g.34263  ORF Transcript_16928/g.34263 Transcript_16928/m.34263 type:complete len:241 (-) Transcript_16928:176-898(-)|eukprot:CAMPEP_0167790774 /NCGR_PEP_ID=MMETSP0111_2-20121227/11533_1 /TAXON_ID=91324 /ORGANISM="Lotharella globosa, Strain CCCM811" /LENGTH=240 /DNA_ID=CAMNT_0007683301 /DNA_START=6 /DNA_END=728 /DNA_ORIENTATION=+
MPEVTQAKKTMSKETLERLSKPVVRKEPKDMYAKCTFSPKLCEKSLELTASREKFHSRIETVIANHKKSMDARVNPKPRFSFQPAITKDEALEAKLAGRGDFYKRTADDIATRKKKAETNKQEAVAAFSFKPTITQNSKVKVEGTFLERVAKDQDQRKNRDRSVKVDGECKFQPEISKQSMKIMKDKGGGNKFMTRMEEDLQKRKDKLAATRKLLAKPPKGFGMKKRGGSKKKDDEEEEE